MRTKSLIKRHAAVFNLVQGRDTMMAYLLFTHLYTIVSMTILPKWYISITSLEYFMKLKQLDPVELITSQYRDLMQCVLYSKTL